MGFYLYIKQLIINFKDNFQAIIKIVLVSNWRPNIPKPNAEKLIILANAPTLNDNLDRIINDFGQDEIMVCNFFYKHPRFQELKPKYYTIVDPSFQFINLERAPQIKDFYLDLFAIVDWKMNLFLPQMYKKRIKKIIAELNLENRNINIVWYNSINFNGNTKFIFYLFSKKLGIPSPANVAIPCLMLGITMNFKKIGILGIELKYHENIAVSEKNEFLIKEVRFYEDEEKITYKPIYFGHTTNDKMDVSDFFDMEYRIFQSLKKVRKFADSKKVKILNYSKGSFIDQFEKV